jgi:hypothetical protein
VSTQRIPELTTEQAAWIAGVRPAVVRVWIHRGHIRRTRRDLIDGESLMTYLDNRGTRGQHRPKEQP